MFNFSLDTSNGDALLEDQAVGTRSGAEEGCKTSLSPVPNDIPAAKEIPILPFHGEIAQHVAHSVFSISYFGTNLCYISGEQACNIPTAVSIPGGMELKSLISLSDSQHSDLIPGVYEGGLKVWECAFDLVQFLSESDLDLTGMRVLELGCGTGLPGIYSLIKGARTTHFQDYNAEVLDYITIPNVILNTASKHSSHSGTKKHEMVDVGSENGVMTAKIMTENGSKLKNDQVKFYSGDWSVLSSVLEPVDKYDVILTSETIYSKESQPKLLSVLKQLCHHGGVVYVAAKTNYFGVGGGVASFCQLVEEDGTFNVHQCRKIPANVPRVILKLSREGTT